MGGVLPHSTYGTELVEVSARDFNSLRAQCIAAAGHKPIGTPRELHIMMMGVSRDPGFLVAMRPLSRWAREVWLQTAGKGRGGSQDSITANEIWQAWEVLRRAEEEKRPVVQGPIRGIQGPLKC